jgi:hypothetical protein
MSAGTVQLPPDHPPIPTTSSADFPTVPPPACPMSSQLAATRPTPTPTAAIANANANAANGNGNHYTHPYAGQVFTLGTRNSKLAMVRAGPAVCLASLPACLLSHARDGMPSGPQACTRLICANLKTGPDRDRSPRARRTLARLRDPYPRNGQSFHHQSLPCSTFIKNALVSRSPSAAELFTLRCCRPLSETMSRLNRSTLLEEKVGFLSLSH